VCTWAGIGSLTTCPYIHEIKETCRNRKILQEGQEDQEGVIQHWDLLGNEPSGHSLSFGLSSSVIYLFGCIDSFPRPQPMRRCDHRGDLLQRHVRTLSVAPYQLIASIVLGSTSRRRPRVEAPWRQQCCSCSFFWQPHLLRPNCILLFPCCWLRRPSLNIR
jgi:hypothetical protein